MMRIGINMNMIGNTLLNCEHTLSLIVWFAMMPPRQGVGCGLEVGPGLVTSQNISTIVSRFILHSSRVTAKMAIERANPRRKLPNAM